MFADVVDAQSAARLALSAEPETLTAAELRAHLRDLDRLRAEVDRATLAATGVFEATAAFADDGAVDASQWLLHWCELSGHAARVNVRVARRLRSMPVVAAAAEAGELGPDKVRLLALARTPDRAEVFAEHEAWLVTMAKQYTVDNTAYLLRHWCHRVDGQKADPDDERMQSNRRLHASTTIGGSVAGSFDLPPEQGAVFVAELERLCDEMFRGGGTDREGATPSPQQRRADALVEDGATFLGRRFRDHRARSPVHQRDHRLRHVCQGPGS